MALGGTLKGLTVNEFQKCLKGSSPMTDFVFL